MTTAVYLGIEEKSAKRIGIDPKTLGQKKAAETARIVEDFRKYESGVSGPYAVPFSNIEDRMDVKYCINDRGRKKGKWKRVGYEAIELGKVLQPQAGRELAVENDELYQLLRVTYDGEIVDGELTLGEDCSYSKLYRVKSWDILVSNIGFGRGAVGIVPPFHDGKMVSNEYTILRAPTKEESVFYTSLLRTKEILGDILASTTGMNRGRIKWDIIGKAEVPSYATGDPEIEALVEELTEFWRAYGTFVESKARHVTAIVDKLDLDSKDSFERWLSFKPPE